MSSKIYEEYMNSHPDGDMDIASVGFVLHEIDKAMNAHTHDGENSPLIDQSITPVLDHSAKSPMDHPDGSMTTSKMADLSVTSEKLAILNVTAEKLADFLDLTGKTIRVKSPPL